ncbi:hypothetical protein BK123_27340 [Paenibacillus lautus]|uniref:Uncharacterized protein n=1 Tax=Paenibacillus lautus TaxID=1401 RepID=A0A1R1AU53_PAELA|nr:hypothetical protein BK123_27340 [Paenibacillus lautus]
MRKNWILYCHTWATLIAILEKGNETRWATKYRGASPFTGKKINREACEVPEIKEALARHG